MSAPVCAFGGEERSVLPCVCAADCREKGKNVGVHCVCLCCDGAKIPLDNSDRLLEFVRR